MRFGCQPDEPWCFSGDQWQMQQCFNVFTNIYNNAVFGCQLDEPCCFSGDHCQMQQYFNVLTDICKVLFLVLFHCCILLEIKLAAIVFFFFFFFNLLLSLLLVSRELQDLLMHWSYHCLALSNRYVMAKNINMFATYKKHCLSIILCNGLVKDCGNSSANALELPQPCTKTSLK